MGSMTLSWWLIAIHAFARPVYDIANDSLLWGPYRSNLYFGVRPRVPNGPIFGLMWTSSKDGQPDNEKLRHDCNQDDKLPGYGWIVYDAREGGQQVLPDPTNGFNLTTHFLKQGEDAGGDRWTATISGVQTTPVHESSRLHTIFYLGSKTSDISCSVRDLHGAVHEAVECKGHSAELGPYCIHITSNVPQNKITLRAAQAADRDIWKAKSIWIDPVARGDKASRKPDESANLYFIEWIFTDAFEIRIHYSCKEHLQSWTSDNLHQLTENIKFRSRERFRDVLKPQEPFDNPDHFEFSQTMLSNVLGGIGYFHGNSRFAPGSRLTATSPEAVFTPDTELFTCVPSRSFFPRGFLWDEGFHLLTVLEYDPSLALEVLESWYALMDEDGWIAREQILGPEARSKVPEEFQIQYTDFANPPTLFMVVLKLMKLVDRCSAANCPQYPHLDVRNARYRLTRVHAKMQKQYTWFRRTQSAVLGDRFAATNLTGYRWKGRTSQHIPTSGLDDYPRPTMHPGELHVDALSWVGFMAASLLQAAEFVGQQDGQRQQYREQVEVVKQSIEQLHWSDKDETFCDATLTDGHLQYTCHKGYISLFPFILGLVDEDHPHLAPILKLISSDEELWSPHGIRSLSKQDKLHGTLENYWRSPIWVNMNYLVLERLRALATGTGPYKDDARTLYNTLRKNLVDTVYNSWKTTGFAWEQYNDETGRGQRTQHSTGWTALIVNILASPPLLLLSASDVPLVENERPLEPWLGRERRRSWPIVVMQQQIYLPLALLIFGWVFRRRIVMLLIRIRNRFG